MTPWDAGEPTRRSFLKASAAVALAPLTACEPKPEARGRVRASLWFSYGGRNREVLEKLVARFNSAQSEHFVDAVFQGDYYEALAKLRTAMAARAGPTISHVIGEVIPYLADAGTLESLDGYPGADALGIIPELGQEKSWVGGGARPLVALPFNRSTPIAYLNGDLLDEHKLKPPTTWAEMREVSRALSTREGDTTTRFGFECPISWWFWVAMVGQAGGQVIAPDGTATLGDDAGVRALELWRTLIDVDKSMKPPPGRDYNAWEATNQDFLAGRAAMIWTSTAFLKYLETNAKFRVVAAPLPADRRRAVPTGGTHFVMLKDGPEENKEAGWAFLRWMMGTAQTIEWATSTGYMPVTHAAIDQLTKEKYYEKHPNDRVAFDQLEVAFPWPWSPELFRIQREIVQPRLEGAILGERDIAEVLAEARTLALRSVR